jgi:ADP-ribosylglycohydrolase
MMGGQTHGIGWGQRNYHPGKKSGDNTDYGEQNIFLLEYLAETTTTTPASQHKPFDINDYVTSYWLQQYNGYQSGQCRACGAWIDTMVKTVLSNLDRGIPLAKAGGMSNGQVVRFSGALATYKDEEELVHIAHETTSFTNNNFQPILASEFWARVTHRALKGEIDLETIMVEVAENIGDTFILEKVNQAIAKVKEVQDPQSHLYAEEYVDDLALTSMARLWHVGKTEPIKVGKASPTEGTLPGAIYFILKYRNFKQAVAANAMVGGDNASRSIPIGMVLGAYQGIQSIPIEWLSTLSEYKNIKKCLYRLGYTLPASINVTDSEL